MIKENLNDIEKRIQKACHRSKRNRSEVTLIAVSKTKPLDMIREAYNCNMRHFGENKVQEMVQKFEVLQNELKEPIYWHQIGHLQRNKVKYIIDKACLIHSVDSMRLAQQIEQEAEKQETVVDILIEVNIANEETKFGVLPDEVYSLVQEIRTLPHVRVRGLMTVAPYTTNPEDNRVYFQKMHQLYIDIKTKNNDNKDNGFHTNDKQLSENFSEKIEEQCFNALENTFENYFNVLSMGMTGDYEIAIEEGATMVRVGTGIFGERNYT